MTVNANANQQITLLNQGAEKHEQLGNALLALWLRQNALRVERITKDTERFLDKQERLRNERITNRPNSYQDFKSDWYDYEEENLSNWYND